MIHCSLRRDHSPHKTHSNHHLYPQYISPSGRLQTPSSSLFFIHFTSNKIYKETPPGLFLQNMRCHSKWSLLSRITAVGFPPSEYGECSLCPLYMLCALPVKVCRFSPAVYTMREWYGSIGNSMFAAILDLGGCHAPQSHIDKKLNHLLILSILSPLSSQQSLNDRIFCSQNALRQYA